MKIKLFFLMSLFVFSLTSNAQLPINIPGKNDKPKNDAELMDKSKAKEPLTKMSKAHMQAEIERDRHIRYRKENTVNKYETWPSESFRDEKKILDAWISYTNDGLKYAEESKAMDPKFKWDKLETDYVGELNKLKTEQESAMKDFDWRKKCCDRLIFHHAKASDLLRACINSLKNNDKTFGVYGILTSYNLTAFKDTLAILNSQDPGAELVPCLEKSNKLFKDDIPRFLSETLPAELDVYLKKLRNPSITDLSPLSKYRKAFHLSDTIISGLNHLFTNDLEFEKVKNNYYTKRAELLADAVKALEHRKAVQAADLEATYLPKPVLNDAVLITETMNCVKATLDPGFTVLKVVLHNDWNYERHAYTNQITSRWTTLMIVAKNPNGKCYMQEMNVYKVAADGGGYKKMECDDFIGFFGTAENPNGQEIKCERVK